MFDRVIRMIRREHCRLELGRSSVRVTKVGSNQKSLLQTVDRSQPDCLDATPDLMAESIATVLASLGDRLPVHAMLDDDIVRYFMVTPPANGMRLQDLKGAADLRFQTLYGESVTPWKLVADWHGNLPFLACAVPRRVLEALRAATAARRSRLMSVTPAFVATWNAMRRDLSADVWLATLNDGALTLGVIGRSSRPSLAAVRTLIPQSNDLSTASLCEEVARAALFENVQPPSLLHIHSRSGVDTLPESGSVAGGMSVRWHIGGVCEPVSQSDGTAARTNFVRSGATT